MSEDLKGEVGILVSLIQGINGQVGFLVKEIEMLRKENRDLRDMFFKLQTTLEAPPSEDEVDALMRPVVAKLDEQNETVKHLKNQNEILNLLPGEILRLMEEQSKRIDALQAEIGKVQVSNTLQADKLQREFTQLPAKLINILEIQGNLMQQVIKDKIKLVTDEIINLQRLFFRNQDELPKSWKEKVTNIFKRENYEDE